MVLKVAITALRHQNEHFLKLWQVTSLAYESLRQPFANSNFYAPFVTLPLFIWFVFFSCLFRYSWFFWMNSSSYLQRNITLKSWTFLSQAHKISRLDGQIEAFPERQLALFRFSLQTPHSSIHSIRHPLVPRYSPGTDFLQSSRNKRIGPRLLFREIRISF